MTWKDYMIMVVAKEREEVAGWRRFRFVGYMTYLSTSVDKNKKSIEAFMPLPGDKNDRKERMQDEEVLNALKIYGIGNRNAQA